MKIQNEYLIIIDQKKSKGFSSLCNTEERFNEFLCNTSSLKINKLTIEHNCNKYSYLLKRGEIKEKNQAFFHLVTALDGEAKQLSEYKLYIKELKSALSNDILSVTSLRDDVSFHYSQQAYSLIHIIESLMRKFITYFMITNIGENWIEESSPESIKQALDKSKRNQYVNMLQQLDFIHLGDFLFKTYNNEDVSNLFKKIKSLDNSKRTVDIELIKSYLPKSNWEKYFKGKVNCEDLYLKSRWEKIYDLRNKVAHNSNFSEDDYNNLMQMVEEVRLKLEEAFGKIDSIHLKPEDKNSISEDIKDIAINAEASDIINTETLKLIGNAIPAVGSIVGLLAALR